jgi:hypothetical protein
LSGDPRIVSMKLLDSLGMDSALLLILKNEQRL